MLINIGQCFYDDLVAPLKKTLPPLLIALTLCVPGLRAMAVTFEKVALSGETAPGTTRQFGAISFLNSPFQAARLNNAGQVTFIAELEGFNSQRGGIWSGTPGNIQPIALDLDPAPRIPAGQVLKIFSPIFPFKIPEKSLGGNGESVFSANIVLQQDPRVAVSGGIWQGTPGNLRNIVLEGDQAPGAEPGRLIDRFFGSLRTLALNGNDDLLFQSSITNTDGTSSNDQGLWVSSTGGISPVAIESQQIPGQPGGAVFDRLSSGGDSLNNVGQVLFFGATNQGPIANNRGLWLGSAGGTPRPVVQTGDTFPAIDFFGAPYTFTVGSHNSAGELNDAGQVLFTPGDSGLWLDTGGVLQPIALQHAQPPGTPVGSKFRSFLNTSSATLFSTPAFELNNAGEIAFSARIEQPGSGNSPHGIWAGTPDNFRLLALEGDALPGSDGLILSFPFFPRPILNEIGQVAFSATLTDGSIFGKQTVWVAERDMPPTLIAGKGDLVDLSPGDQRVIREVDVIGLNDNSQALLDITFTDNSRGLFVATVPEPATGFMALGAAAGMVMKRRR